MKNHRKRVLAIVPAIVFGIALVMFVRARRGEPERRPESERQALVRVIEVDSVRMVPKVVGYGTAMPGRVWQAAATVPPAVPAGGVIRLVQADAFDLPFAAGAFDYCLASMFLHHLPEQRQIVLSERIGFDRVRVGARH